ncbi:sulfotransferase family protein [Acidisoma sp. 7E03]
MAGRKDRVVLILGMHRSGTSLLARILHHLGLPLGERLLTGPMPDNPQGYWEHAEIVAIQDGLLAALDRSWWGRHALSPLPHGWQNAAATQAARRALRDILRAELASAPGLWGFKDPRTLRFLPLWQEILEELGLETKLILAMRHPAAVAQSLRQRNGHRLGFAQALWAFNMQEVLATAGGQLTAVIDYDLWFVRPSSLCAHLCAHLGLACPAAWPVHLLDAGLRHHGQTEAPCHPAATALHTALAEAAPAALPPARLNPLLVPLSAMIRRQHGWFRLLPRG